MKPADYQLPETVLEEIKACEVLISICKPQLRNPKSSAMLAYATLSHALQKRIENLRREEGTGLHLEKAESASLLIVGGSR